MAMEIINGFVCNSCADVSAAKKMIDPAAPAAGPVNPKTEPTVKFGPAVILGGSLGGGQNSASERDADIFRPYGPDARR